MSNREKALLSESPASIDPAVGKRGVISLQGLFGGPLYLAGRGSWSGFAGLAFLELLGLILIGGWITGVAESSPVLFATIGGLLIVVSRLTTALAPFWSRDDGLSPDAAAGQPRRLRAGFVLLLLIYPVTLYRFLAAEPLAILASFPAPKRLNTDTATAIDNVFNWMKRNWVDFFDALTAILRGSLQLIEALFIATPWPVVALVAIVLGWKLSGFRVAIFTAASLAYIGLFGFWDNSMSTMALVATSVLICIIFGMPIGILCAKSRRADTLIVPVLDVMQTLPTFVYLIPAVAFFSIGKVPGVIATVIFALPSMIRPTALGIRGVPSPVREAADAFGATPAQMLFKVELPLAVPALRLGVNQTIMMSLSMVVVASMIGAGGLGEGVMKSLAHLKTGQGFLTGFAIVLCAMVLDRMVRGRDAPEGPMGGGARDPLKKD